MITTVQDLINELEKCTDKDLIVTGWRNGEIIPLKFVDDQFAGVVYLNLIGEDNIVELCPHCEEEVELPNEFRDHKCPECNKVILPCSICTVLQEGLCTEENCPLKEAVDGQIPNRFETTKEA